MAETETEFTEKSNRETRLSSSFRTSTTSIHPCTIDSDRIKNRYFCGCYELDEETQTRKGRVYVYQNGESDGDSSSFSEIQSIELPSGVLDLNWSQNFLILALSDSTLTIHRELDDSWVSTHNQMVQDEGLFLSVKNNFEASQGNDKIVVSTQSGSVIVYTLSDSEGLVQTAHISSGHTLFGENMPVWISNINPYDSQMVISGGDDMQFKIWDLRLDSTPTKPIFISKHHQAGVTSIEWSPFDANCFMTGSYDESIAFWDHRSLRRPLYLIETGGGAWRANWLAQPKGMSSSKYQYFSIANMQHGASIYQIDLSGDRQISDSCQNKHVLYTDGSEKHLTYGLSEISRRPIHQDQDDSLVTGVEFVMASCSFYDNLVSEWTARFEV